MNLFTFGARKEELLPSDTGSSSSGYSHPSDANKDNEIIVNCCSCCGTLVKFPVSVTKYKCSVCQSTVSLNSAVESNQALPELSLRRMMLIINKCQAETTTQPYTIHHHSLYRPLEKYITDSFSSIAVLNKSFLLNSHLKSLNHNYNIDYDEVNQLFAVLISLPSKRPYYKLLLAVNDLLRRPPITLDESVVIRWLLILFEIPTLVDCLYHERKQASIKKNPLDTPEVKTLSYEIIKRIIGYLSHCGKKTMESLAQSLNSEYVERFSFKVQLINLYITFHLTRIINKNLKQKVSLKDFKNLSLHESNSPNYSEYHDSEKLNTSRPTSSLVSPDAQPSSRFPFLQLPITIQNGFTNWSNQNLRSSNINNSNIRDSKISDFKLKVSDYGHEWHIKSAARLLSVFYSANKKKLPIYSFYNTLVDYIQVKQDFEVWQNVFHPAKQNDPNKVFYDIIKSGGLSTSTSYNDPNSTTQMTFCQYPFLLSLGAKISILEYEARKSMEQKAEEAFIKAMDKRKIMDVNLRIQVRRSHITNDSLRSIKSHHGDLKKALKVEFIGEAGIDAGGLKKEWFLLLTKSLFNQENGMFQYSDESNLCWFAPMPLERNDELYYMVGVVLGLAIYNSTILDLRFPLVLYKKLLDKKVTLEDYTELFPSTGKGLLDLLHYKGNVTELSLYFDTTFKDCFGELVVKELIPNGSNIQVTNENRRSYVNKWVDFYLNTIIAPQFSSFVRGFQNVIGGNALSLFSPKEIEMIICGNNETKIDTESFKSITKYSGWNNQLQAEQSNICKWFWEWFDDLSYKDQKKFLSFVTGSDRIPATGVSTMNFKITRLQTSLKVKKLPVAHTCFNELCLYDYETKQEIIYKLNFSINESEGFGLR